MSEWHRGGSCERPVIRPQDLSSHKAIAQNMYSSSSSHLRIYNVVELLCIHVIQHDSDERRIGFPNVTARLKIGSLSHNICALSSDFCFPCPQRLFLRLPRTSYATRVAPVLLPLINFRVGKIVPLGQSNHFDCDIVFFLLFPGLHSNEFVKCTCGMV